MPSAILNNYADCYTECNTECRYAKRYSEFIAPYLIAQKGTFVPGIISRIFEWFIGPCVNDGNFLVFVDIEGEVD